METSATRYRKDDKELVPRFLVRTMLAIVLVCLAMTAAYVWTGAPKQSTPPQSAVVIERTLYLSGDLSGAAQVRNDAQVVIADLSPEEGGFVSGVWRVLQRERTKARVALDGPVTVTGFENGRVAIFDPSTGWGADLMGFGQDNAAAFAKLLRNN